MYENVITIEECRRRYQEQSCDPVLNMGGSFLRLVTENESREVSPELVECAWSKQLAPADSTSMTCILAGLPIALTIIYMVLAYSLHLW